MLVSEESRTATRSVEDIWALWSIPSNWPTWDPDVADVHFEADFTVGATGTLKPSVGPRMKWRIESVQPLESFVTTARLPGTLVRFIHRMDVQDADHVVTHRIEMSGWSAPLLGRIVGPRLAPSLAQAVEAVACDVPRTERRGQAAV